MHLKHARTHTAILLQLDERNWSNAYAYPKNRADLGDEHFRQTPIFSLFPRRVGEQGSLDYRKPGSRVGYGC